MAEKLKAANWLLGLVGAAAGGALGYFAFFFLADEGFYAMVLPGALLGIGCGALSGVRSNALGVVCGLLALLLGAFIEWRLRPFNADDSFAYFIAHVSHLQKTTLVLMALGGFLGFWFGKGREGGVWPRKEARSPKQ